VTTASDASLADLRAVCPGAELMQERGVTYIHIPVLRLPPGCVPAEVEALLRPGPGPDGYTTRLFFSHPFPSRGQNWTTHRILDKPWHTFSFNNVPADSRLVEMLINHLSVLR
jgi:hypothetical protein